MPTAAASYVRRYFGIACVALTPNLMVAAILSGAFYGLFNLFAGFVMPRPNFPGWYLWGYYLNPVTWRCAHCRPMML